MRLEGPLVDSLLYKLALLPVAPDGDAETKATHRVLRARFGLHPDIYVRGDAENAPAHG